MFKNCFYIAVIVLLFTVSFLVFILIGVLESGLFNFDASKMADNRKTRKFNAQATRFNISKTILAGYSAFQTFVHRIHTFVLTDKKSIRNHIVWWVVLFFVDFCFGYAISTKELPFDILGYIKSVCFIVTFFYTFFFFALQQNLPKHVLKAIINGFIVLFIFIIVKYFIDSKYSSTKLPANYLKYFAFEVWRFYLDIFYAVAYWIYLQSLKEQRLRYLSEIKLKETQEELLKTEIKFLKAQVNPHFLFNTLNFFYVEAYRLSPKLGEGILKLTEIMRYTVQSTQNEEIPIEKEGVFLRKYIEIQQLRFHNTLQVKLDINIQAPEMRIPPLIILTFVENAFKYGKLNDAENPLVVSLTNDSKNIAFYCKNLKNTHFKEPSTSVGIENIRIRLEKHCSNFILDAESNEKFYSINLQIKY